MRGLPAAFLSCVVLAACSAEEWDFGQCTSDADCSTRNCVVETHICGAAAAVGGSDGAADAVGEAGDAADTGPDVTAETGPGVTADAGAEVGPDVGADVVPDVADVGPEVGPDVVADVGPEVGPDVGADGGRDALVDSGPDVFGDGGPCGGCAAGLVCDPPSNMCGVCSSLAGDVCPSHMACVNAACVPEGE